ncbi:Tetraspanin-17 [Toxocara canis]|uniref:Tetraspanin-17 n=1 Tax=Toxocara canis TaxID=6265 RepID=A0A0B2V147_TOXCA|nr:Tetraspanin-17 [Toxocara canis]
MTRHKGAQWSQVCLLIYTLLFWLSGFTLIFLALWALLDPRRSYVLDLVNFSDDDPLLRAAVCLSMLTGLLTLIVGFVACCGAIKKSRCMLVTLVIFLTIILCAEATVGILAISYRSKFAGDSISAYMTNMTHNRYNRDYWVTPLIDAVQYYFLVNNFDVKLRTLIRDEYGIRLRNERNAHITSLIDRLQFYEECCGSQNATNWNGSRWRITIDSSLSSMESDSRAYSLFNSVPPTCCVQLVGATPINPVARSLARCQQPEASKTWRHQPQQCCGGLGPRDYYDSFWYKTNVLRGTRSFVPPSCCKQTQRARSSSIQPVDSMCTTYTYYSSPFNSSVNIEGCHEKLLLWLDTQTTIFASVGFSFAAFQQQCCGGLGPRDYYDSFWYKTNVLRGTRSFVPPSCCKQTQRARSSSIQPVDSMCTTYTYYSSPFNSSVNIEGCHEKLLLWLDTQTTIFASVGFSFAAFQEAYTTLSVSNVGAPSSVGFDLFSSNRSIYWIDSHDDKFVKRASDIGNTVTHTISLSRYSGCAILFAVAVDELGRQLFVSCAEHGLSHASSIHVWRIMVHVFGAVVKIFVIVSFEKLFFFFAARMRQMEDRVLHEFLYDPSY